MPKPSEALDQVCYQMMKGPNYGRLNATNAQREVFRRRHEAEIRWVISYLPRSSMAVPAVLMKYLIKYGKEKTTVLLKAIRDCTFDGADDPAYHLWTYMQKNNGKDTVAIYQKTLCAVRNYAEGKRISGLSPYKTDLFSWDVGFTIPDEYIMEYAQTQKEIRNEMVTT